MVNELIDERRILQNTAKPNTVLVNTNKKVFGPLNQTEYQFVKSHSRNLTKTPTSTGSKLSGSGHSVAGVNNSTAGFIMMAVILFILITLYMAWKVYKDKKYFSKEWEKQYGKSGFDKGAAEAAPKEQDPRNQSQLALNRDSMISN